MGKNVLDSRAFLFFFEIPLRTLPARYILKCNIIGLHVQLVSCTAPENYCDREYAR